MKTFLEIARERYAAKHYDNSRKIPKDDIDALKEILRLTPSAVNIQPWCFYIGSTDEDKQKILPAIPDFNTSRITDCSHFVVLCAKTHMTDDELSQITDKEVADGRYTKDGEINIEIMHEVDKHRKIFADLHVELGDFKEWTAKQTYIAMGALLYGAASLGIDSTPIEGMDYEMVDDILKLKDKSLRSVAIVALGYRAYNDSNSKRPKSRLSEDKIFESIS